MYRVTKSHTKSVVRSLSDLKETMQWIYLFVNIYLNIFSMYIEHTIYINGGGHSQSFFLTEKNKILGLVSIWFCFWSVSGHNN